jgi:selenocysteine lyase/cysteine desulfurase
MGQRDDAAVVSMATAAAFHEAIGPERVESRVRALSLAVKEQVVDRFPGVRLHTPMDPELSGGVVVFALPGADHQAVYQGVYETHRLGCAAMGGDFEGIRLSPHIYNTLDEVTGAMDAVAAHV